MSDQEVLKVDGIDVYYRDFQALWQVSVQARKGQVVSVIGANGAGKSTLLNTIAGLMTPRSGDISFLGDSITGFAAHEMVARRIALVPEGRRGSRRELFRKGKLPPRNRFWRVDRAVPVVE